MTLADLADVKFVDADPDEIMAALVADYLEITKRKTLAKGDPVRLFLLAVAESIVRLRNAINYTGKMNLLKYAEGDFLDHMGAFFDTPRLDAAAAATTIKITLSTARERGTVIPAGTRISNGDRLYFSLPEEAVIPAGETEILVPAECMETGETGNDYMPGEISTIVDPVPYVASMANTTKTEGGSERETDAHYRERIHEAPEKFSTAGPYGAYRYWAMSASALIADAQPYGPEDSPGEVEIYVLLENGGIPGEEMLSKVLDAVADDEKGVRPFTDHVTAKPPDIVEYDLSLEYYMLSGADATATEKAVEEAVDGYVLWQKAKLGRDINPDELVLRLKSINGVKRVNILSPVFTSLDERQVALAGSVQIRAMGSEDE